MSMHIIAKKIRTRNHLGGGRVALYTLSDGRVLTVKEILDEFGFTSGCFFWRIERFGLSSPKVLLKTRNYKNRQRDRKPTLFHEHKFQRGTVCIKDGICCANYSKCQDARIIDKNWQKPEGNCYVYVKPRYYGEVRSVMGRGVV